MLQLLEWWCNVINMELKPSTIMNFPFLHTRHQCFYKLTVLKMSPLDVTQKQEKSKINFICHAASSEINRGPSANICMMVALCNHF